MVNFDKLDYCSSLSNLNEVARMSNYKFIKGNLCSADLLSYILESEQIDTIIHAAAQVRRSTKRRPPPPPIERSDFESSPFVTSHFAQ